MTNSRFNYHQELAAPAGTKRSPQGRRARHKLRPQQDQQSHIRRSCANGSSISRLPARSGNAPLNALVAKAEWFSLPGGAAAARDGDNDQAVFIVVTRMPRRLHPG